MPNNETLQEYRRNIRRLREESIQAGISEEEFEKMYLDNLKNLGICNSNSRKKICLMIVGVLLSSCILTVIVINYYTSLYSCITCNLQEYIYPGLRLLRKLSIPLISLFPSLTDLYQETCLIQNPFFNVVDMDCWPCSIVNNVGEIFEPQPLDKQHNSPFIYKTEQKEVNIGTIKELYIEHKYIFIKENAKILVNNQYYQPLSSTFENSDNLFIWKINSIEIARTLRKIIARPKVVPKFGQSIERFIIIVSKHKTFKIPDTECNFSFILATSGSRIIELRPAEECKHQCKTFKVKLKQSYLLWYNWWYWRPSIQQSSSNKTFIAHVGSYC